MSEKLPPLNTADIEEPLRNPTFSAYIYIGEETDKGWLIAETIESLLPRLRTYLAANISLLDGIVEPDDRHAGIVFGWNEHPFSFLTRTQTEDFLEVFNEIKKAREKLQP